MQNDQRPRHTTPYSLTEHDKLTIDGDSYRVKARINRGYLLVSANGLEERFSDAQLNEYIRSGKMDIEPDGNNPNKEPAKIAYGDRPLVELTPSEQELIFWRQKYCDELIKARDEGRAKLSYRSIKNFLSETSAIFYQQASIDELNCARAKPTIITQGVPSQYQLYDWAHRYLDFGRNPICLLDLYRRSGNAYPRIDKDRLEFLKKEAKHYLSNTEPTMAEGYRLYIANCDQANLQRQSCELAPLVKVSKPTYNKIIKAFDDIYVLAARNGVDTAVSKTRPSLDGLQIIRPGQLVEIDEWEVEIIILDKDNAENTTIDTNRTTQNLRRTRAWLVAAIDCATASILGARLFLKSPCGESAISVLEMIMTDKQQLFTGSSAPSRHGYNTAHQKKFHLIAPHTLLLSHLSIRLTLWVSQHFIQKPSIQICAL